jgi:hypothetical protein
LVSYWYPSQSLNPQGIKKTVRKKEIKEKLKVTWSGVFSEKPQPVFKTVKSVSPAASPRISGVGSLS